MGCLPLAAWGAVDFSRQVRPVLEANCMACHNEAYLKKHIAAGKPDESKVYTTVVQAPGSKNAMPPTGARLSPAQADALRLWIAEGAVWTAAKPRDERTLVSALHKRILAGSPEKTPAAMKAYKATIPGTTVAYEMAPIPGGEFTMGTPATEKGRKADEGPQHKVALEPFWMAKFEVTWDEYRLFQFWAGNGTEAEVDAVSHPTRPYVEMSFGMGINGYPAISMTQHAANKYAQWLSAKTGHFYRLPTEAEWEYACRAGSTTAFSFGDASSGLGEYGWFVDNSDGKYQKVGTKKPNAWGLHDMHGNVAEWTLDQYAADFYAKPEAAGASPLARSTKPYPQVVRGGGWTDDPAQLRCGARTASDPSWKMQDPQLPKSIWYLTDAQFLGFRLVRPLKVPSAEEMFRYWNNGVERE